MPHGSRVIGRWEQRALLRSAFEGAASGDGGAVMLSGPGGIGKTTLLGALLDDVGDRALVGWGACWHGQGSPGFWPWTQALEELTRTLGVDAARDAAGPSSAALSVLVPALAVSPRPRRDEHGARVELLADAVRWLRRVTSERPVVLVLDDLQWADESSLDLLDQVLAAPSRSRLLVVGAFRPDDLAADRRRRLGELTQRAAHVQLAGLDVEAVAELAVAEGGEQLRPLAAQLHARTGGHPLFVRELARLPEPGPSGQLPDAVMEAVDQRLEDLPTDTRRGLDVAAVAGNVVRVEVVGAVLALDPLAVHDLLEAAVECGVLHRDGDETRFAHDLFREALYLQVPAADRIRLHAAVGQAMAARADRGAAASVGDVARHLCDGLPVADAPDAVAWAERAATVERRRSAFAEAAHHLTRVRSRVGAFGSEVDPGRLHTLLLEEVECLARSGAPDEARDLLARALAVATVPERVADLALAHHRLGSRFAVRRDEVLTGLRRARAVIEGIDDAREARVTAALARALQHSVSEERDQAHHLSERALELGRACGDDTTLIECLLARHDALWRPGTGAARAELGAEITEVAGRTGDVDRIADGLLLEANGLLEAGEPTFRTVLDRWFALVETRDEPKDHYLALTRRAALALLDVRLDDARRLMSASAELGEAIGEPDTSNVLMSQRVAYAHASGDPTELTELARDAVAHWTGAPVHAHAVAAGALALAGDLEGAAKHLAAVGASGGWEREDSYLRSVYLPYLATAAAALGERELCRAMLAEVEQLTSNSGVNGAVVAYAGPFAATAAVLAEALGDHDGAAAHRAAATRVAGRLGAQAWVAGGDAVGPSDDGPTLVQSARTWTVSWGDEHAAVPHTKGMGDLATLVQNPRVPIAALALASPGAAVQELTVPVVDRQALAAYRRRLAELDAARDGAHAANDIGRMGLLEEEREVLLAELRSVTGLGDRIRPASGDQAERARKAVSARIRDTLRKLAEVAPRVAAHLDRSVTTGLRCTYDPPPDEPDPVWSVEDDRQGGRAIHPDQHIADER